MIAWQVMAAAMRDALFLSNFSVTALPAMVIVSSLLAVPIVLAAARLTTAFSPARFAPGAFAAVSGMTLLVALLTATSPKAGAVAMYLLVTAGGGVLVSAFWSLVNERFDPRTGKAVFSRIAVGATVGGVVGGIAAERVAVWFGVVDGLPILAVLHLLCTVAILVVVRGAPAPIPTVAAEQSGGPTVLKSRRYLQLLAALVVAGALSGEVVDYLFKSMAADNWQGDELMRFFAVAYGVMGVATFVGQSFITQRVLQRLSLGRTAAVRPVLMGVGALVGVLVPGLPAAAGLWGTRELTTGVLSRSVYELLFIPLHPAEKRRTKVLIDVGARRIGAALGGLLLSGVLAMTLSPTPLLFAVVGVICLVTFGLAMRLDRGYITVLERALMTHQPSTDPLGGVEDGFTRSVLQQTLANLDLVGLDLNASRVLRSQVPNERPASKPAATSQSSSDRVASRWLELRSGDISRVTAALAAPMRPEFVGEVLRLVAWDEVSNQALAALQPIAAQHTGQLCDALLDPDEPFAIRRRIPRVLAHGHPERAMDGLIRALADRRFEVRYQCSRALARLHQRCRLDIPETRVRDLILTEVAVEAPVWKSRTLLDDDETDGEIDAFLRARSGRSLEHVFRLLSLLLPADPLWVAFRGLHTDEAQLRGMALEYLDNVLDPKINAALWPHLDGKPPTNDSSLSSSEVLDQLMASHHSIQMRLDELRQLDD